MKQLPITQVLLTAVINLIALMAFIIIVNGYIQADDMYMERFTNHKDSILNSSKGK